MIPKRYRRELYALAKILLTEDDEAVRAFVRRALEIDGHHLTIAEDGTQALDHLTSANGDFDLLLSDIQMPLMDGIALAMNAKRDYPDLKIILMTGFADQRERANGMDALVIDVVPKPFSLVDIRNAVSRALSA